MYIMYACSVPSMSYKFPGKIPMETRSSRKQSRQALLHAVNID